MPGSGIVVILVIALALLAMVMLLPTIVTITEAFNVATETPLYDIIQILPYAFIGLAAVGSIWAVSKM